MPPTPRKSTKPGSDSPFSPATPAPVVERSQVKGSGTFKSSSSRQVTHEQIAKRAYEIYASRGYAPGDQNADWLEAERQLKAGL